MDAMPSEGRDPVWPDEVELQSQLAPSEWILPRLLPSFLTRSDGMPVGAIVPSGYPAYVRVLHPANAGTRVGPMTWRDVAALSGTVYHPLMQLHQIRDGGAKAAGVRGIWDPMTGKLDHEECHGLYAALSAWTSTPDVCWMGVWEGHGSLRAPSGGSVWVFRCGGACVENV